MLPYKEFTDEEIIKAVECCSEPCCVCDECPLYCVGVNCSSFELHRYALDLINRQKSEIDSLRADLKRVCAERDAHICTNNFIKSEAVKEFSERLKSLVNQHHYMLANIHNSRDFGMFTVGFEQAIDNIVKEMVGVNTMNDNKEVKVLTHKVIRVDNLMYDGCEPHWKCTRCGKCVPFHCYTKEQFENQECNITDC